MFKVLQNIQMSTETGGFNGIENSLDPGEILVVMPWFRGYHYYKIYSTEI